MVRAVCSSKESSRSDYPNSWGAKGEGRRGKKREEEGRRGKNLTTDYIFEFIILIAMLRSLLDVQYY
jgi:hypothetical protein